ncbi:MAG: hypothetical protein MPW16_04010 [Candidatus Manganitrophus sp.]|nr:MAG: hypothetical protein MPW16_04010 [Candidatus Manganitrophus sp.]
MPARHHAFEAEQSADQESSGDPGKDSEAEAEDTVRQPAHDGCASGAMTNRNQHGQDHPDRVDQDPLSSKRF